MLRVQHIWDNLFLGIWYNIENRIMLDIQR